MANSLDESEMTLAGAIIRYRLTGVPLPAHLRELGITPVKGTSKPRGTDRLPTKLNWSKPWYRLGGNGHDGNGSSMHGRSPGQIDHHRIGELTKADINETEAL
jgi:hypothetical protein